MKILLVHNDYGKYSGEEKAVEMMTLMLESMEFSLVQLRTSTCESRYNFIGKARVFLNSIYSHSGRILMRRQLQNISPDLVIINNLYPFISPWALLECRKANVPVVMRVHNYRLLCPNGLFYNKKGICEECLERGNEWACIFNNCTGEILKSITYTLRNMLARKLKLYTNNVDRYVCLTNFQKTKLIAGGLPEEKIDVIVNHVVDLPKKEISVGDYIGICGRISPEKGMDIILQVAILCPDIPFKIAGEICDSYSAYVPYNVELCGFLEKDNLERFYLGARFMLSCSRCYEGQPMTIIEAAMYSKISVIPLHGGFLEILSSSGLQEQAGYRANDLSSMVDKIRYLWNNPLECVKLGILLRSVVEKEYSLSGVNYKWKSVLEKVISERKQNNR